MKFSELTAVFSEPPRVMSRSLAAVYVGGNELLKELEGADFIAPCRRTKRKVRPKGASTCIPFPWRSP